jgi:phage tail-like protein
MAEAKQPRPVTHFKLTIGGKESVGLFREVTGFDTESDVIEYKSADANGRPLIRKVSGNPKWSDLVLKRGVDSQKVLAEWRKLVEEGGPDKARTDCTLELLDYDGSPIHTYSILQAWPRKYTAAALKADSNEVAVEEITLAHEGFKLM